MRGKGRRLRRHLPVAGSGAGHQATKKRRRQRRSPGASGPERQRQLMQRMTTSRRAT